MPTSAGNVSVTFTANGTSFSQTTKQIIKDAQAMAGGVKAASHSNVTSMQASSAAIRDLNGNFATNTRAVERFITMIPGVGKALQVAFPLIGGLAFGAMIVDMAEKVAAFITKVNQMPAAITKGFGQLNLSAQMANDTLKLTNDTLQNNIDKLQGKPQNNLAIQIDEARLAADRLAQSILKDNDAITQLLSQNHLTGWAMLLGSAGTADREGTVNAYSKQQSALGLQYQQAVHNGDTTGAARIQGQINASRQSELQNMTGDITRRQSSGQLNPLTAVAQMFGINLPGHVNQDANIAIDQGVSTNILAQQNSTSLQNDNAGLEAQNKKLEAQKAFADAQKKASAAQMQQWEADNEAWKAVENRSLADDEAWWSAKLNTLTSRSGNYIAVSKKVYADIIAINRENAEAIQKYTTEYMDDFDKSSGLSSDAQKQLNDSGKSAVAYIQSLRQQIDLTKQNTLATSESSIAMQLKTGSITKLDAAQQLANLHTSQYNQLTDDFTAQRNAIASDPTLSDLARQASNSDLNNRVSQAANARAIQQAQDNQATSPAMSSPMAGVSNALDEFVNATQDAAKTMQEITKNTLDSINSQLVKGITGQKMNWGKTFTGVGQNIAGKGLQTLEGSALKAFGFGGKADGSKGSPFYVRMADGAAGAVGGAAHGIMDLFHSGSGSPSSSSSSSGAGGSVLSSVGGAVSRFLKFIPGFAAGGALSANSMNLIGEHGPELFMPSTPGTIVPNHQISNIGGNNNSGHTFNIDARGASDPAQVRAQVQAGVRQSVATSQKVAHQSAIRKPSR